ncbi:hypothetical protein IAQ61_007548 [Plenodomus lingam]|uniref:uncharacterized protein n=1 Tax=Leptosphaeria maculans TaxID=5022 RepID=UPI00331D1472|nr:hypothetical protein IAQ61_007548 [Plenodomus lingam]
MPTEPLTTPAPCNKKESQKSVRGRGKGVYQLASNNYKSVRTTDPDIPPIHSNPKKEDRTLVTKENRLLVKNKKKPQSLHNNVHGKREEEKKKANMLMSSPILLYSTNASSRLLPLLLTPTPSPCDT